MQVTVRNLGVLKEVQIELKPLTVLVGPNNAGKTWLAYTLAGILGPYGWNSYMRAYVFEQVPKVYQSLEDAIQQIIEKGNTKIDLVRFVEEYGELYLNNVAQFARTWMQDFMGTARVDFDSMEVQFHQAETQSEWEQQVLLYSTEIGFSIGRERGQPLLTGLKESGKRELFVYTSAEGSVIDELPERAIRNFVIGLVFQALQYSLYQGVYTFPAERTAYITMPFRPQKVEDEAQVPLTRSFDSSEQETRILSWPIGHFLTTTINQFQSSLSKRKRAARSNQAIKKYMDLAQLLERNILNGGVDFSTTEPDSGREILFKPTREDTLEIPIASSMVKELTPLVLYLRYLAQSGEMLVIDEPEMNLHPEAQAKIVEFLAMLVHAGLHIIIATHSPYVVDHLANLIAASKRENQDVIREMFYLQNKEAFIPPDKVSVYQIDQGTAKPLLDEQGIIHWDTFGRVSDKVTRIYFDLQQ